MNKWIIFISIVCIVSVIGVVLKFLLTPPSYEDSYASNEEGESYTIPDPVVQFSNISEYTISPGVLVLHTDGFSMNFLGNQAPPVYESLAEVGDPSAVIAILQNNPNIEAVFKVGAIEPNGKQHITIPHPLAGTGYINGNPILVSYMAMITETNDGVVWLNGSRLFDPEYNIYTENPFPTVLQDSIITEVLDMGTEQNEPISSGFAGGQPDPTRGAENSNNGTSTNEPVRHHPQFYEDNSVSDEIVLIQSE